MFNSYKNVYSIKSPFDYNVKINNKEYSTPDYGQNFFNKYVLPRDIPNRLISLRAPKIIFFSDNLNTELEVLPPALSPNRFNDCMYISGKFNIGKHFRPLELALAFYKDVEINIRKNDDLYYVKFHSPKKVKLVRFLFTEELKNLMHCFYNVRNYSKKALSLSYYYERIVNFGFRKKFLQLLKQNKISS